MGCRYLQLDDTSLAYLNDPAQRAMINERGDDAEHLHLRYIKQINAAVDGRPEGMNVTTHMCRGNFRSSWTAEGGYDFVAEALFSELNVDGFFLEFDDARSGGFEPLRFVPPGKMVVLGLVTTKRGELESKDDLKRRIDEASRFVPLEQICLSPQCGFSSTVEGNVLTAEQQSAKLRLIAETAQEIWGDAAPAHRRPGVHRGPRGGAVRGRRAGRLCAAHLRHRRRPERAGAVAGGRPGRSSSATDPRPGRHGARLVAGRDADRVPARAGWPAAGVAAPGGRRRARTPHRPAARGGPPVWSPDGSRIAFTAPVGPPPGDAPVVTDRLDYQSDGLGLIGATRRHVHVVDVTTRQSWQVTDGDWHAGAPCWSPDGTRLAFSAATAPDADLTPRAPVHVIDVTRKATSHQAASPEIASPNTALPEAASPDAAVAEAAPPEAGVAEAGVAEVVGLVEGCGGAVVWALDGRSLLVAGWPGRRWGIPGYCGCRSVAGRP